jgi:hypothetical protein
MTALSEALRRQVFLRAHERCEYCQTARRLIGMLLVVDHIIAQARGGSDDSENLCGACYRCNEFKGSRAYALDPVTNALVPLYNPRSQPWIEHFRWANGGTHIIGVTDIGRATVIALRLNNEHVVESRALWVLYGWHPPREALIASEE